MDIKQRLAHILTSQQGQRDALIPVLQQVQDELGYLPEEAIAEIGRFLGISRSVIYGVASFYAQFRFDKRGKHVVRVCQGTACHVKGSNRILDEVERKLGICRGETTKDGEFTLERVACIGCCALAPVVVIDEAVHAKMTPTEVKKKLDTVGS